MKQLTKKYESRQWKFGELSLFTCEMEEHYTWGNITLQYLVEHPNISSCRIYSDVIDVDLIPKLQQALTDCQFMLSYRIA